ncbi:TPA: hypothetical protein ACKRHO_002027 [Morganella morganii]
MSYTVVVKLYSEEEEKTFSGVERISEDGNLIILVGANGGPVAMFDKSDIQKILPTQE